MAFTPNEVKQGQPTTAKSAFREEIYDFSLVLGGPAFRFFRKAHLSGDHLELLHRRLITITSIAWVPLLLLDLLGRQAAGIGRLSFLHDVEVQVRFLVALPVLIAAELIAHSRIRLVVRRFVERRIVREEDTSANVPNLGGSVVGWGINLTSNLNLSKNNVAKLEFVYGRGIENYMNDAPFDVGIANNPPGSKVPIKGVALPLYGVVAFLDHTWNEHFTSSAGYSLLDIVNSNAEKVSDFHQGDYVLANLLYHPVPKVMMGGEFQFGRRENFRDGFNYNDYRVQFSFKYDWDKSFKSPSF
jgi:hypothetical protein